MNTISFSEWRKVARRNGIPDTVYEARVLNKWEHERAACEKLNDRYASKHFTPVERATMKENGIPLQTAIRRLKSGKYTREQAISERIVRRVKDEL